MHLTALSTISNLSIRQVAATLAQVVRSMSAELSQASPVGLRSLHRRSENGVSGLLCFFRNERLITDMLMRGKRIITGLGCPHREDREKNKGQECLLPIG